MADTLSKTDLTNARQALYKCRVAEMEIEKCKSCNLDMTEEEARLAHVKEFLTALLEQYGPSGGRPSTPPN